MHWGAVSCFKRALIDSAAGGLVACKDSDCRRSAWLKEEDVREGRIITGADAGGIAADIYRKLNGYHTENV